MTKILFVCHGNICRSPMAEFVMKDMAAKAGAKTVGLGPRILRCETAPLAVLSAVMTLTGNLE